MRGVPSGHSACVPLLVQATAPSYSAIALARSAAAENASGHATIEVLTASGYKATAKGDNGFVCLVLRGWAAPTFTPARFRGVVYHGKERAPICYNPVASRTVLP